MSQIFVLSVGGSLVVSKKGIDCTWLKKFKMVILNEVKKGNRFYLIVGGGLTARQYIKAALEISRLGTASQDLVGIAATRLNAELIRSLFGVTAYPAVITDPTKTIKTKSSILVAAGYKPGWSTDYVAVLAAQHSGVKKVINLSNIDYAYNKDPRQFKDAQKLVNVSWSEFKQVVGDVWRPGANTPFDPIASKLAAKNKYSVVILNGHNLKNLSDCLKSRPYIGTTIS